MRRLKTYEFILNATNVHGDRYDYSNVNYIDNKSQINIICDKHGLFRQRLTRHLSGDGCPKCNGGIKLNQTEFINKVNSIHNNIYDYSLTEYVNSQTKIEIICSKHGVFEMKPNNHMSGQGCPLCAKENSFLTTSQFIEKARKIHGNIYDYSLVDYERNDIKIKIICSEHGVFE